MPTTNSADTLVPNTFAGAGALVAVAWLIAYLVPITRRLMLDWIGAILLQALATGLLWHVGFSMGGSRFWLLLASGWTLNAAATLGWGIHWWLAGKKELPALSWVDGLYAIRYLLLFLALGSLTDLPWLPMMAAAAAAAPMVGLVARSTQKESHSRSLGKGLYAVLDTALVCATFLAWRQKAAQPIGLITLAFAAYGVANWVNLVSGGEQSRARLASFFWPLADLFAGLAVLCVLWGNGAQATLPQAAIDRACGLV